MYLPKFSRIVDFQSSHHYSLTSLIYKFICIWLISWSSFFFCKYWKFFIIYEKDSSKRHQQKGILGNLKDFEIFSILKAVTSVDLCKKFWVFEKLEFFQKIFEHMNPIKVMVFISIFILLR